MKPLEPEIEDALVPLVSASLGPVAAPAGERPSAAAAYLAGLGSSGSRERQFYALRAIVRVLTAGQHEDPHTFAWAALEHHHGQALRTVLAERYALATANRFLSAYRGVLKSAWRLGDMTEEQRARASDIQNVKGSTLPAGRLLGREEVALLFAACERDPSKLRGARDKAMLAVLDGAGLRRAELVGCTVEDWRPAEKALRVLGKGNKERLGFLPPSSIEVLETWLRVRSESWASWTKGEGVTVGGVIFCSVINERPQVTRDLSPDRVRVILQQRIEEAATGAATPHDFRRTVISRLLDKGVDLNKVKDMVGHAQIATTARYDRRGHKGAAEAAALLDEGD